MYEDFDADELFHLALKASESGDHEKALTFYKRGLALEPSARFHYLLGAEYAEIGMYERGAQEMLKAVELNPELHGAVFQLGMLYYVLNQVENCLEMWSRLDVLEESNPYRIFKNAILAMEDGRIDQANTEFLRGMALNKENAALNNDMEKLRLKMLEKVESKAASAEEASMEESAEGHFLLSAYKETM